MKLRSSISLCITCYQGTTNSWTSCYFRGTFLIRPVSIQGIPSDLSRWNWNRQNNQLPWTCQIWTCLSGPFGVKFSKSFVKSNKDLRGALQTCKLKLSSSTEVKGMFFEFKWVDLVKLGRCLFLFSEMFKIVEMQWKNLSCLRYIGDYTTQLCFFLKINHYSPL